MMRSIVAALGIVTVCLTMAPSAAHADSWCWSTQGFNARKMAYDAWTRGNSAGLSATVKGTTFKPIEINGKSAPVSAHYIGLFKDRSIAAPDYWAYDQGAVTFTLQKEKDPTSYSLSNKLGIADRLGVKVHVCVYKKPRSKDWAYIEEVNRSASSEPNVNNPSASIAIDGSAPVGVMKVGIVNGLINDDFVVAFVTRDSQNFSGQLKLHVKAVRVEKGSKGYKGD